MEIGIDSFAASMDKKDAGSASNRMRSMEELLQRIEQADRYGLDIFGIGEHHRKEFLDSAPAIILAAAAARTHRIRLTSAVTVLSAADPVRVFQNFATLDLISRGRAEMVVGRGSFSEAFPLFGLDFENYDDLFIEKLDLLLKIRENETLTWAGRFRPKLKEQSIYPRPVQEKIPIWVGVGGTPASFVRAGELGLPLMVAVIGGETHRFRPLIDLYRQAGERAGFRSQDLKVGLHSFGYVSESTSKALDEFYPGYEESITRIGKERGWAPVTRGQFEYQAGPTGAYIIGSPEEVAEKIIRHSKSLGGVDRLTFQMDSGALSQDKLMNAIQLIGSKVIPLVQEKLKAE